MKKLHPVLVLAAAALVSCGNNAQDIREQTWQVSAIYTSPDQPGIPETAAGSANLYFGHSTFTGSTGCSALQGEIRFSEDRKQVTFANTHVENQHDCEGALRYVHDKLVPLLDETYDLATDTDDELVLIQQGDAVDRPTIKLLR